MKPRLPSLQRAPRGAWVARAAVVLGLAASIALLLSASDGPTLAQLAGIEPEIGAVCAGFGNAVEFGAL